jgi:hypothetical protein
LEWLPPYSSVLVHTIRRLAVGIALGMLLGVLWKTRGLALGRWAVVTTVGLCAIGAVSWLGLYEGGYNHLGKKLIPQVRTGAARGVQKRHVDPSLSGGSIRARRHSTSRSRTYFTVSAGLWVASRRRNSPSPTRTTSARPALGGPGCLSGSTKDSGRCLARH